MLGRFFRDYPGDFLAFNLPIICCIPFERNELHGFMRLRSVNDKSIESRSAIERAINDQSFNECLSRLGVNGN